ncbi:MAG: hypothetical protein Q7W56_11195 [Candidatus Latescibacteria bacterium]|nr:hypothetical protein [Candidatus Latescibacterota bacterium]
MPATPWTSPSPPSSPAEPRAGRRRLLPLCCAAAVLAAALVAAAAPVPSRLGDDDLRREIGRRLRDGDLVPARELIEEALRRRPDDPLLHYNAACVAARLSDPAAALASVRAAVAHGYDDARGLRADPDLGALRADPVFAQLIADLERRLSAAARDRALSPRWGAWFDPGPLTGPDAAAAGLRVSLMFDDLGWHLRAAGEPAPSLELTLAVPDSGEAFDTARVWRFGFEAQGTVPTGRVLAQPGRRLDLAVLELAPVWRDVDGRRVLQADIPWSYLEPYAPPADTLFGVNVAHFRRDDDGRTLAAQLVRDPRRADPRPGPRRYLPLTLPPGGEQPRLRGRVTSTIVGVKPLGFTITAWVPGGGAGRLITGIGDTAGHELVTAGDTSARVTLVPGLNKWTREADLAALTTGPYRLEAVLELDGGARLSWFTGLARFNQEWFGDAHDRTKFLAEVDRPAVDYRLDLIRTELSARDRRADPSSLLMTVFEVEDCLRLGAGGASVLTDGSVTVTALDAGGEGWLPVRVALPTAAADATAPVLLLLEPGGAAAARIFDALTPLVLESGAFAVALPSLHDAFGRWTPAASAEASAVVDWLPRALPGRRVLLVGFGAEPDRLDALARAHPDVVTSVHRGPLPAAAADAARSLAAWAASAAP